jgi:GT2 family glycosyltransferase
MFHLAIVIVNYNNSQDAIRALSHAYVAATKNVTITFFVVDNFSSTCERNKLGSIGKYPLFRSTLVAHHVNQINPLEIAPINIVYLPTNYGFSHASNTVLRLASVSGLAYSHYLLLNSDCFVLPDTIQELLNCYEDSIPSSPYSRIGAIGGTLLYNHDPSLIQSAAGGWILPLIFASRHYCYGNRINYARLPFIRHPDFITGALLLLSREAILSTGLFDESFFLYQEDKDYCLRLKKAGFQLAHSPTALALHKEGGSMASNGFSLYYTTRNLFYIINKHANSFRHLRVLIYLSFALSNAFLKPKPFFTQKVILRAFQAYCLRLSGSSFLPTNL